MGIISNFDSRIYEVCKALKIYTFFDSFTLSSEVGAAKPDPKIFHFALKKHHLIPEEAFHIEDSREEDVGGAFSAGMNSILINRSGNFGKKKGEKDQFSLDKSYPIFSDLKELLSFFK